MKTHILPAQFDGAKFAARYSLNSLVGDFFVDGDNLLHYPDLVPDEPIFDPPDPPQPQGTLSWENSAVPGSLRLVATFNGKKSVVVGAVGADVTDVAMYQSPGPMSNQATGPPRREFHAATKADIVNIPIPPNDGDTLYIDLGNEYRFILGNWHRVLYGPTIDSLADVTNLYALLNQKLDAAINPPTGPQIDARIKAVLVELRKLI